MARLDRFERCNRRVSQQGLEQSPAHLGAFSCSRISAPPAQNRVKTQQVLGFRPIRIAELEPALRIGLGA